MAWPMLALALALATFQPGSPRGSCAVWQGHTACRAAIDRGIETKTMKKPMIVAGMACCWMALPALAEECTALASFPVTISTPGKYCLAANSETASSNGATVLIDANDVELDCKGHTLRSTSASATGRSSAILAVNRNNVRVTNCRIMGGYTYGIHFSQSNTVPNQTYYITIDNNYIAGPYSDGIVAFGSAIEIRDNRVLDVGGQLNAAAFGIRIGGSQVGFKFQTVHGNHVVGTNSPYSHAFGIYSSNSIGSVFHKNLVNGTSGKAGFKGYGIRISAGGGNTITSNYVLDAGPGTDGVGIQTPQNGGWCYDNQLRAAQWTIGCDASLGNY